MQHPHRRWEGCRGDPWGNGLPEPARARGQEPADKAEHREKTLTLLLSETRELWRKLDCLKSNAYRAMEGLWRQRLTARWTLSPGKRTAWAPSAGPAPPNEGGKRPAWTASLTLGRIARVHGGMASRTRVPRSRSPRRSRRWGAPMPGAKGGRWMTSARQRVREARIPAPRGWRPLESCLRSKDSRAVWRGTGSKGSHDLARGLLYLRGMPAGPARERPNAPPHRGGTPGEAGPHPWSLKRVQFL